MEAKVDLETETQEVPAVLKATVVKDLVNRDLISRSQYRLLSKK